VSAAEFMREHPDVTISPPGNGGYRQWIARRDGKILANDYQLGGLLAALEELLGRP
jgi:hypothetical protein